MHKPMTCRRLRSFMVFMACALALPSAKAAEPSPHPWIPSEPGGRKAASRELWKPTLTERNQARLLQKCDKAQLSFLMSDVGRYSKAEKYVDREAMARYAARKVLASQLEALQPEIYERWKEYGVSLRSREAHAGEPSPSSRRGPDLDVGFRSGEPFVGTRILGARLTLTWDWRESRTIFAASRPVGPVRGKFEIRSGRNDSDEVRLGITIPLGW